MKVTLKGILGATALAAALIFGAHTASAGLIGVAKIRVYSALPDWLQIAEVIATQTGTGTDVALATNGATATGTSNYSSLSVPGNAIDGVYPADYPNIWHSGSPGGGEYLQVQLAAAAELSSVTIYGRAGCCTNRDIYNVYMYSSSGTLLYSALNADASRAGFVTLTMPDTSGTGIPEPFSLALLGTGLAGIGLMRRR